MKRILVVLALMIVGLGWFVVAQDGASGNGNSSVFTIDNIVAAVLTVTLPWFIGLIRRVLGLEDISDGGGFLLAILFSLIVAAIGKSLYIIINQEVFSLAFVGTKSFWYEGAAIVSVSQLVFQMIKRRAPNLVGKST